MRLDALSLPTKTPVKRTFVSVVQELVIEPGNEAVKESKQLGGDYSGNLITLTGANHSVHSRSSPYLGPALHSTPGGFPDLSGNNLSAVLKSQTHSNLTIPKIACHPRTVCDNFVLNGDVFQVGPGKRISIGALKTLSLFRTFH